MRKSHLTDALSDRPVLGQSVDMCYRCMRPRQFCVCGACVCGALR